MSNWEKTMKEWDDSIPDGIKYLSAENRVLTRKVRELESENARLKEAQRWIPVSERLPEDREEVLTIDSFEAYALSVFQKKATVLDDNNAWEEVENAFYIEGRGINPDSKSADYPTHWMPLPEPSQVTE